MERNEIFAKILSGGLLPILINDDFPAGPCAEAILAAGFEAVEISCRHERALEVIVQLKRDCPELAVGAASLIEDGLYRDYLAKTRNIPTIAEAVEAGADFLVSLLPFRKASYDAWSTTHIMIPGVATAGEAHQALDWGANLVKFCNPALVGGPAMFKGMDAATHRGFPFFTTGGMTPQVIPDYIAAGVLVFGAGLDIILKDNYETVRRDFDPPALIKALSAYSEAIDAARAEYMPRVPFKDGDPAAIERACGRFLNL